jgi:DNA-binding response OmpR family regulator
MPSEELVSLRVGKHSVKLSQMNRTIIVDEILLRCTPTEYRILEPLLQGRALPDHYLVEAAFAEACTATSLRSLKRHIENLRSKLEPSGLSIHRVSRYGYILVDSIDM